MKSLNIYINEVKLNSETFVFGVPFLSQTRGISLNLNFNELYLVNRTVDIYFKNIEKYSHFNFESDTYITFEDRTSTVHNFEDNKPNSFSVLKSNFSIKLEPNEFVEFKKIVENKRSYFQKITDKYAAGLIYISKYIGFRQPTSDYDKFYRVIVHTSLPSSFKKVPSVIYRGMWFSKSVVDKIIEGKRFSINQRRLSSWSTSKEYVKEYLDNHGQGYGIIFKINPKSSDIFFNVSDPSEYYFRIIAKFFDRVTEWEVVCKGNAGLSTNMSLIDLDEIMYDFKFKKATDFKK